MREMEGTAAVLRQLQHAGVGVLLDDFGTGDSSLPCLPRLPISGLKLDRAFTNSESPQPSLQLSVMAEGIETTEQRDRLRALCGNYAHGVPPQCRAGWSRRTRYSGWRRHTCRGRTPVICAIG